MGNIAILMQILLPLIDRASQISALLQRAQGEGRDVTDKELDVLFQDDDVARAALQDAIDKAKGG